jgi:hypothetical protein
MNLANESTGSLREFPAAEPDAGHSRVKSVVAAALALWLGLVLILGAKGAFVGAPHSPPLAIFLGFAVPLAAFFAAYARGGAFREFVLGADLRLASAMQAWRFGGLGLLALYAQGLLPGLFAIPAGLGDMAIAATAPWMVLGLIRRPSFATSRGYLRWNLLGIADLVLAVSLGTLGSGLFPGITGGVTTGLMSRLPLVLIPAYFVPFFLMAHCAALFQARQSVRSGRSATEPKA